MAEIRCFNVDFTELIKTKPDKFYDLAIIDPPYGIGESGGKNKTRGGLANPIEYKDYFGNDKEPPTKSEFDEIIRVSKNQIFWGANHFISRIPYDSHGWIVWDKDNGGNDFADCELAWTSFYCAVRKFKWRWAGMLQGNMKNKQNRIHPNEKPIELYSWILQKYAKKGQKIIDTHGGSFSHAIAAEIEGFDLDICEIDKHYFDLGTERFEKFKLNLKEIRELGYAKTEISKQYPVLF